MEPIESSVAYVVHTTVLEVLKRTERIHKGGIGDQALFEESLVGWDIVLNYFGVLRLNLEEPPFKPGDLIKITIAKRKLHDLPPQSPVE